MRAIEKCLRRKATYFRERLSVDVPGWVATRCLAWKGRRKETDSLPARPLAPLLAKAKIPAVQVGHAFDGDGAQKTTCVLLESELGVTALDESFAPAFDGLDLFVSDTNPVMIYGCRDGEPIVMAAEFLP